MYGETGWDLLRKANYQEAIDFFLQELQQGATNFTHYWGLGKAYLNFGERDEARNRLRQALVAALQVWDKGEIPYDLVETIEKDLDRATGDAEKRILNRSCDYLLGLLRLTGAMWLEEAVIMVEKNANLKLVPWWDSLLQELQQDTRFRLKMGKIICLPMVADPEYLIRTREELQVTAAYTLDDVARNFRQDYWENIKQELQPILDSVSGGNLKSSELLAVILNSKTFREALDEIGIRTRLYDLRAVAGKWHKLLYQLWVTLPRWELGFKSLGEVGIEDLWLGQLSLREIANLLGLTVDAEGNFYCPDCGERIALSQIHQH